MLLSEIEKLPKIDLHCHLDGSLSLSCIKNILHRDVKVSELQVADDCKNLAEYLEKFELPLQALQTKEDLRQAGFDFLTEIAKENVKYVEARFAPMLSVHENLDCKQVIESVLEGFEEAKKQVDVKYQLITCAMRHHSLEQNLTMIKAAREFLHEGVCAADLAGNEAAFPMIEFKSLFEEIYRMDMPFTIHAGECGRVENILDALLLHTKRIGHGIAMRGNQKTMELCKENQIGIEMCPISNLQTKAIQGKEYYPMKEFLDEGLLVTINTDNRMVSNTSLTKEIEFVQTNYNITDEEVIRMLQNAVEVSFTDEETKTQLRKVVRNYGKI